MAFRNRNLTASPLQVRKIAFILLPSALAAICSLAVLSVESAGPSPPPLEIELSLGNQGDQPELENIIICDFGRGHHNFVSRAIPPALSGITMDELIANISIDIERPSFDCSFTPSCQLR
jgi:hypothetical protein